MKKKILVVLFIVLLIMNGCTGNTVSKGNVDVIISKNFGDEIISQKSIKIAEGDFVIDIMQNEFEIETAYGGGFINSINGIKSGYTNQSNKVKMDWFYYVNGYLSEIGSSDYEVEVGDIVIWDYHDWNSIRFNQAIIGAYPNTFTGTYMEEKGTVEIIGTSKYFSDIEKLKEYLCSKKIENINLKSLSENDIENTQIHTIVIGEWEEIKDNEIIKEIYKNRNKTGLFFTIDENIQGLDCKGEPVDTAIFNKGAVITSVLKGYGDIGTLWLVTGNDSEEIKKAIKVLYEKSDKIKGKFSIIMSEDKIYNLPITKGL